MTSNPKTITRFAPSPTGFFHIGAVRTALFNYAFAKKNKGTMILRIEDTDTSRSKKEYEKDILDSLQWLGITYDGPYRQSERGDFYKRYLKKLIESGNAYESEEKGNAVIRFKNPNKKIVFTDSVRGEISFDTTELGDFIVARSIESPLYNFAVVVDDYEMGVTNLIRGEDHISNTPRQILIQEALGISAPSYSHIPLVLAPDKSKLSKRNLDVAMIAVKDYREEGYLPEAMLQYLVVLGWAPTGKNNEIFTIEEFIDMFSLERIQKGGAQFDIIKLRWINKEHMKKLTDEEISSEILKYIPSKIKKLPQYNEERLNKGIHAILERIEVFSDVKKMGESGEIDYIFAPPQYDNPQKLVAQNEDGGKRVLAKKHIGNIIDILSNIAPGNFSANDIKEAIWDYATKEGRGDVLWPMRYALSGLDRSPDPFTISYILGKDETIKRLRGAEEALK